jgi:hypothetical protein
LEYWNKKIVNFTCVHEDGTLKPAEVILKREEMCEGE